MKRIFRILLAVALTLTLALLIACGKDKNPPTEEPTAPPHASDGKYQSDENSHWFGCTACGEHRYGEEAHTFVANGKNKKCSACGREAAYTDEENVLDWIAGRDGTLNYRGAYTADGVYEYDDDGDKTRREDHESWDSGRYILIKTDYITDENGAYIIGDRGTSALIPVPGGRFPRSIYYFAQYEGDTGDTYRSAQYVSPDYIDDERDYEPCEQLGEYGLENGTDRAGLVAGITAAIEEAGEDTKVTVSFTREDDGSVTLRIHVITSAPYHDSETDTAIGRYNIDSTVRFVARGGYIVSVAADWNYTLVYDDAAAGTSASTQNDVTEITYGTFDDKAFAAIDVSGVEIVDQYYGHIDLHMAGTDTAFSYSDTLMGGEVTAKTLCGYLASRYSRFVGFGDADSEKVFEIYTDPQMTNRFTGMTLLEEDADLYFRLQAPDDAAVVITIFRGKNGDMLQIAYLWNDERFYPRVHFDTHKVLSIDGEPVGEYAAFACEKGRVYTVVYDDTGAEVPPVEHKALSEWNHDEYAHWHNCTECGYETFNYSLHNETVRDGMKVCSVCGYSVPFTDEENFRIISGGIAASQNENSRYSYRLIYDMIDPATGDVISKRIFSEGRLINKYFSITEMYYADEDGTLALMARDLNAYKYLDDIGRWKWYTERTAPDGSLQKTGTLKKPSFSLESYVHLCSPAAFVDQVLFGCGGDTYEEFCALYTAACIEEYTSYDGGTCTVTGFSVKRNDDGTVTLSFTIEGEYVDSRNSDDGYLRDTYVYRCELTAAETGIVGYRESGQTTVHYEDEAKNIVDAWQTHETYSSEFDSETYDSISVETDTTTDEYVTSVSFVINGYHYGYSMSDIPVGSSFTLADVQNFLADVGEGASKPLFTYDVDPAMFNVYYDKTLDMPFVKWDVINGDPITLYVEMVIPEGKAIVISLYEADGVRGIQLCYFRDVGADFKITENNTYPLVEVDGTAVTDGSTTATITCSESRIYTFVHRMR